MQADLVALPELSAAELSAWSELAASAISPNPFAEPQLVLPAAQGLGVRDVGVLRVRDGRDWVAATPVRSISAWRRLPGRCLAVWRHPYSFLGTPLAAAEGCERALALLVDRGLREGGSFALDRVEATGPLAGPLAAVLESRARVVVLEELERAALYRLSASGEGQPALSPDHRRDLGRKLRKLEREVGGLTLRDRSGDAECYDAFLALERSGWKGRAGTAMACEPGHARFFLELCRGFAAGGRLELLSLASDRQEVAAMCNLIAGDTAFGFKIAFDERLARHSPGVQLILAYSERFLAGPLAVADSCTDPGNDTANRLWPARRRLRTVVAVGRGAAGALRWANWRRVERSGGSLSL